jgi:WD40 repeat protein
MRTLSEHMSVVWGCAISPSEDTIISASQDQTLKVWDARTGEERLTLRGHTGLSGIGFSLPSFDQPASDGRDAAVASVSVAPGSSSVA